MSAVASIGTVHIPSSPNSPRLEPRSSRGTYFYAHPEVVSATTLPTSSGWPSEEKVKGNMLEVTKKSTGS